MKITIEIIKDPDSDDAFEVKFDEERGEQGLNHREVIGLIVKTLMWDFLYHDL